LFIHYSCFRSIILLPVVSSSKLINSILLFYVKEFPFMVCSWWFHSGHRWFHSGHRWFHSGHRWFIQDIDGFIQDIALFLRNCLNIINTSCSLHSVVSRITRDCIFMSGSSLCNDFFGNKKGNKRKTWLEPWLFSIMINSNKS